MVQDADHFHVSGGPIELAEAQSPTTAIGSALEADMTAPYSAIAVL
ncbi:hypothetical protein [Streptomyces osmaniensis]|uniref:Uncharacterized protein n=1 Tax=Streptomyces osmaniensis TaxID=593134 RepID=A0ABP6Z327_9ACTN|nr:hypothetical protein KJK32_46100 [Streptomyces sp. JCM17656]